MKAETKAKWQRRWNGIKRKASTASKYILPAVTGATFGAAWVGWKGAIANSRRIKELEEQDRAIIDAVENNAKCQLHDRQTLLELERQQNLLFEKALRVTEGKDEAA